MPKMVVQLPAWWRADIWQLIEGYLSSGYSRLATASDSDGSDDDGLPTTEKQHRVCFSSNGFTNLGYSLLPSFITHSEPLPKANPTTYLNGLRGLAACIVVLQHLTQDYYPFIHQAYGSREEDTYLIQLPFIRVLLSGRFMVGIFFIISGFVLSHSSLRKAHANERATSNLASAFFRRPIRLFLPVLPVALISGFLVWTGIFYHDGSTTEYQHTNDRVVVEVWEGWHQWRLMAWTPFDWGDYLPPYFPQCWTLNAEFRGSVVVFIAALVLSRVAVWVRFAIVGWVAWDAMSTASNRWSVFCFLAGFLLADLRCLRDKWKAGGGELSAPIRITGKAASIAILVLGLFLGGWPSGGDREGLWFSDFADLPTGGNNAQYYWFSIASVMVVAALENLPLLQDLLNTPLMLYLGEISFGLYLVHWAIIATFGKGVIRALRDRGVGDNSSFAVGGVIALALCIWAGDVHWRLVDRKCVKFSRWAAEKLGV
jgi:peptidoglycan/LPS O-acetylase OafA/YrhL